MRLFIFIATVSLMSCGQNSSKENKATSKIDTTVATAVNDDPTDNSTPEERMVIRALRAQYGNKWHVMNDRDAKWMKDVFDYFIAPRRKEDPNYPYIARGDYDADNLVDLAAIVTDSLKRNYQIVILLEQGNILFWKEDIMNDAAISTIPKSDIAGMDGENTKKIKMKGDGIKVEYFEKASFVLYWDKSSFKRIQTGD